MWVIPEILSVHAYMCISGSYIGGFTFSVLPCKCPKSAGTIPQRKVPVLRALDASKRGLYSKLNSKHKTSQAKLCYGFLCSTRQDGI